MNSRLSCFKMRIFLFYSDLLLMWCFYKDISLICLLLHLKKIFWIMATTKMVSSITICQCKHWNGHLRAKYPSARRSVQCHRIMMPFSRHILHTMSGIIISKCLTLGVNVDSSNEKWYDANVHQWLWLYSYTNDYN